MIEARAHSRMRVTVSYAVTRLAKIIIHTRFIIYDMVLWSALIGNESLW